MQYTVANTLLVTTASVASIIQGLDVVERRWREHKNKQKQQGSSSAPASTQPSSTPSQSDTDITHILLVMDDGSPHEQTEWITDLDKLRAYIDAFSDPKSKVKPFQVIFRKRKGRALTVDVTEGGKDNRQLNVILSYLDAKPQP